MPPDYCPDPAPEPLLQGHWSVTAPEPLPLRAPRLSAQGFYFAPPTLCARVLTQALPGHPLFELRYDIGRQLRAVPGTPVRLVNAQIVSRRTGALAGYFQLYLVGRMPGPWPMADLATNCLQACYDLGQALEALVATHVAPSALLQQGLQDHALLHLGTIEVARRYRGRGLGGLAVRTLLAHLARTHAVGLLTYRPYPLQFGPVRALGCDLSHAPQAVAVHQQFLEAAGALSRHYVTQWGATRLFGSEYFIAGVPGHVDLAFNAEQQRWALLPYRPPATPATARVPRAIAKKRVLLASG